MKAIIASGVGVLTLVSVTAFALNGGPATSPPADFRAGFTAEILGDVAASPRGEARFGAIAGEGGANGFAILGRSRPARGNLRLTMAAQERRFAALEGE